MTWLKGYLPYLILCSMCSLVHAQDFIEHNVLPLRAGQKILPEQCHFKVTPQEENASHYYRYLQFYQLPDRQEKLELIASGVELLSYLSNNTYIVTFHAESLSVDWCNPNIRSLVPIAPNEKIDPQIDLSNPINQHLSVQFFENVDAQKAYCQLENHGITINNKLPNNSVFEVECNPTQVKHLLQEPAISFIELAPERKTEDLSGNIQHYTNVLSSGLVNALPLDGSGVHIAIGDDGFVGPHIDFSGRIIENSQSYNATEAHGDMVAGILSGAGNLNPRILGVAPGASLCIFKDFAAVENAGELYSEKGVVLTSTSYGDGCNRGYTTFTQMVDEQINNFHSLMHVFSAGNAGQQDCGYGAGAGWGNITGGVKVGKNVIAVGNLNLYDEIADNSSRGPANDGRIKPDLCARGDGQMSTAPNNEFQVSSGSSAAAPVVTGILAQLYQAYRNLFSGVDPPSDLIKAILLNTADDLGNPGPDYTYGWGKVNALHAYQTILEERYLTTSIEHDQVLTLNINVPNDVQQLKLMVYWHDHKGSTVSSKSLVNDLDCWMQKNGALYHPLTLSSTPNAGELNQVAQPGVDHINNMEQIVINNPPSGNYDLLIHGFNIPFGPQDFVITYEFVKEHLKLTYPYRAERVNKGAPIRIQWDCSPGDSPFELEFSDDLGQSWTSIATVNGDQKHYDWILPEINSAKALVRINRDNLESQNAAPFHIYSAPTNLQVSSVCSDYLSLEWTPVPDAVQYIIYSLQGSIMDTLLSVADNNVEIAINSPDKIHWYAVSAVGPDGLQSMRTNAVTDGVGLKNCDLQYDIRLSDITSPSTNLLQSCFSQNVPVIINLKNDGTQLASNFQVAYQYDDQPPVVETYTGIIPSGITVNHSFASPIAFSSTGPHRLKVWSAMGGDQGLYNDTLEFDLQVVESTPFGLPYFETFDDWELCITDGNCESTCHLSQGWINSNEALGIQMDWRPQSGGTNTLGTGPNRDQNSIDDTGKYLYLEPADGCFNKEAQLYSPCIDLSNSTAPSLIFWVHMRGANMGGLYLDLFDGTTWWNNLINPILGDQGNDWRKVNIDLSAFSGSIINLRFRGTTGNGELGDLAIDNVSILETAAPPTADFTIAHTTACTGQNISLKDNSYNEATGWSWSIHPGTFSFEGGSSASSQNPVISFYEPGSYSIELTTWNDYGFNQIIKADVLTISDGQTIPFVEDFNSLGTTLALKLENPDDKKTWEQIEITGKSAETTPAIYLNNHSYNAAGEEDAIRSNTIDLSDTEKPYLRFDLSYAPFNQYFADGLRVELSDNCQNSFDHILFEASGQSLATAPAQMRGWTPEKSEDWRSIEVDLRSFVGQQIALRFVNICGFGNNLYLDNILVFEYDDFPHPAFQYEEMSSVVCVDEIIEFENISQGKDIHLFEWTFGDMASPSYSTEELPGAVSFQAPGLYQVGLKASNDLGWEVFTHDIRVIENPSAQFTYATSGYEVDFTSGSFNDAQYSWDFGDGVHSKAKNPQHRYDIPGLYTVELTVHNACGTHSESSVIAIKAPLSDSDQLVWTSRPNPIDDILYLDVHSTIDPSIQFQLFDANARLLLEQQMDTSFGAGSARLDVSSFAAGIYFLKVQTSSSFEISKIIIY